MTSEKNKFQTQHIFWIVNGEEAKLRHRLALRSPVCETMVDSYHLDNIISILTKSAKNTKDWQFTI